VGLVDSSSRNDDGGYRDFWLCLWSLDREREFKAGVEKFIIVIDWGKEVVGPGGGF